MFGDVCFLDFFGGMAFSSQGFWGGFPPLLSTFVSQFLFFVCGANSRCFRKGSVVTFWGSLGQMAFSLNCSLHLSPSVLRLSGAIGSFQKVLWKVPRTVHYIVSNLLRLFGANCSLEKVWKGCLEGSQVPPLFSAVLVVSFCSLHLSLMHRHSAEKIHHFIAVRVFVGLI